MTVHEPSASWALMPLPSMRSNSLSLIVTCASALPPAMLMPSPPTGPFERLPVTVQEPSARRGAQGVAADSFKSVARDRQRASPPVTDRPCAPIGPLERLPVTVQEPSVPVACSVAAHGAKGDAWITAAPLPAPVEPGRHDLLGRLCFAAA